MARYSRRNRSRRAGSAGSAYCKVNSEGISVLRLYAHDFPNVDFDGLTATNIRTMLSLPADSRFRLIAVTIAPAITGPGDATNFPTGTSFLEFSASGDTYGMSSNSIKPARIRVPKNDLNTRQWWLVNSNGTVSPTVNGILDAATPLFKVGGNLDSGKSSLVQFVDIAVRF